MRSEVGWDGPSRCGSCSGIRLVRQERTGTAGVVTYIQGPQGPPG